MIWLGTRLRGHWSVWNAIGPGLIHIRANCIRRSGLVFQYTHLEFCDAIGASGLLTLGPRHKLYGVKRRVGVYTKELNRIGKNDAGAFQSTHFH